MTRIIAGFAGSLSLRVPSSGTRPTSDRVREAVFSALEARGAIAGASVLDLYAGSGALGLEAASRGAKTVTLVEHSRQAITVAKTNAKRVTRAAPLDSQPLIRSINQSVRSFLSGKTVPWDLVFLDPPYAVAATEISEVLLLLLPQLNPKAHVLIERDRRAIEPVWPAGLSFYARNNYGDTSIFWCQPA